MAMPESLAAGSSLVRAGCSPQDIEPLYVLVTDSCAEATASMRARSLHLGRHADRAQLIGVAVTALAGSVAVPVLRYGLSVPWYGWHSALVALIGFIYVLGVASTATAADETTGSALIGCWSGRSPRACC